MAGPKQKWIECLGVPLVLKKKHIPLAQSISNICNFVIIVMIFHGYHQYCGLQCHSIPWPDFGCSNPAVLLLVSGGKWSMLHLMPTAKAVQGANDGNLVFTDKYCLY